MAEYDQIMKALRNAHAAGDTAAAARLAQLAREAKAPPKPDGQGFGNNVAQAAGDGLFFGFGDEISARLNAMTGYDASTGTYGNWGTTYDDQLQAVRGQEKQFREDHPVVSTVAEVGGGLVGAAVPIGAAVAAPTLGARAWQGAKTGAALGGLYGFGEGEGGFANRAPAAVPAAGVGAGLGFAIPYAGNIAGKTTKAIRGALNRGRERASLAAKTGVSKRAAGLLSDVVGMDDPALMRKALERSGPDAMLVDAGPTLQGSLDAVIQAPGEGARTAMHRIDDRAARAGQRLTGAMDQVLGTPEGVLTSQKNIRTSTAGARQAAYSNAYGQEIDWRSPAGERLRGLLETTPREALEEANRLRGMKRQPSGIPESAYPEAEVFTRQQPGFWTDAFDQAERKQVDDFFSAYNAARPESGMKRPLTNAIKKSGGIDPGSPAAAELYHLGITPRSTPGLFRKGGLKDLDNLPLDELADSLRFAADDGTGNYASRDAIFQALRGELDGTPVANAPEMPAGYLDDLERMLPEYEARRAALQPVDVPPDPGPVSDLVPMKTVEDIDMIKRGLDDIRRRETDIRGVSSGYGIAADERARAIRDALMEAAPGYDEALALGKDTIRRTEAVQTGAKLLSPSMTREQAAATIKGMTGAERAAAKQGVRSQIDDALANVRMVASDPNVDAREAYKAVTDLSSRSAQEKMELLLGEDWQPLKRQLDQATVALGLRNRVARNSLTFGRQQFNEMLNDMTGPGAVGRAADAIDGFSTLTAPIRGAVKAVSGSTPAAINKARAATKNELAELLTRSGGLDLLNRVESARAYYALPTHAGRGTQRAADRLLLTYGAQSSPELAAKLRRLIAPAASR